MHFPSFRLLLLMAVYGGCCVRLCGADVFASQRQRWWREAEAAKPALYRRTVEPARLVRAVADTAAFQGWRYEPAGNIAAAMQASFRQQRELTFDFGEHLVGTLSFSLHTLSGYQDGPVRLRFRVGELPAELNTPVGAWQSGLSQAWMQDEVVTVTRTDTLVTLPRRFAGRYVRVELLAASAYFDFALSRLTFTAQTSAGPVEATAGRHLPEDFREIFDVGLRTLRDCMQTVFEDGPKRDQRLWLGDFYLEALANRHTFRNFDLTRRCLLLFAANSSDEGLLPSNVLERPVPRERYGYNCLPYALLWNAVLLDYLRDTGDTLTVADLWPVAVRQTDNALTYVDTQWVFNAAQGAVRPWLFFDWRKELDTQAAMQGAVICALRQTYELARLLGRTADVARYPACVRRMVAAARRHFFDARRGVVVSGAEKQVSLLSQAWFIHGGVLSVRESALALRGAFADSAAVRPGTPYATHYVVAAMLRCGLEREARQYVLDYWGGMVAKGADTFWEAYDPRDDSFSPYGFAPLNSACHAWSCTPVCFMSEYPEVFRH